MALIRHDRKSTRLKHWDYTSNGYYVITICTQDRKCYFGHIFDKKMQLSEKGLIANKYWLEIPFHFPFVKLDEYIVMPNHVHGILVIDKNNDHAVIGDDDYVDCDVDGDCDDVVVGNGGVIVGAIHELPLQNQLQQPTYHPQHQHLSTKQQRRKMLIPKIIGRFKMQTAKQINEHKNTRGQPFWQRNYYDHIIRNQNELQRWRRYIVNNQRNWNEDRNFI